MGPGPVDTVDLNVYSFFAQYDRLSYLDPKKGDLENKQVGKDFQKMFPTCSYQGRTIQLNWKIEFPDTFDTPPHANKINSYDFFLAMYGVGDCTGRLDMDFLARKCNPITATRKVIVVTPYNAKMLRDGRPKQHVQDLTYKNSFEREFKNLDKIIPFVYRQDKLAEDALDRADRWQFVNGQDVQKAIQTIVQDKLTQMAKVNKQEPVVNFAADEPVIAVNLAADEPVGVVNFTADESVRVVNFVQDVPPAEEKQPKIRGIPWHNDIITMPEYKVSIWTRLAHLVGAILPSLVAAVTTLAMHILYPKLKEFQIIGIGATAGTVMHLGINFFRKL